MHMATKLRQWTLRDLHSLPDDGNKYELVRGELFVTPPPSDEHETILARLTRLLEPYVAANHLGFVYHPRAVFRFEGSETEPDLMIRQPRSGRAKHGKVVDDWDDAPVPSLIVEVLSDSTRRRDLQQKRQYYIDAGIPEYWIIDGDHREVRVVRLGRDDEVATNELRWHPAGCAEPLVLSVEQIFE